MITKSDSPTAPHEYTWRIPLRTTAQYWEGWFKGLSSRFLTVRAARLLVLAGTDRLDKELMIGQMQGKFQMEVVPDVGHMLHEVCRVRSRDGRDVDAPPGQPAQDCGDIGGVLEEERTGRDWLQEGWRVVGRYCQAANLVILSAGSIFLVWTVTEIMTRAHLVVASLLAFGMVVSAELVELWWNVSYALANPDGRHLRRVIGVNGTWPYNRSPNQTCGLELTIVY